MILTARHLILCLQSAKPSSEMSFPDHVIGHRESEGLSARATEEARKAHFSWQCISSLQCASLLLLKRIRRPFHRSITLHVYECPIQPVQIRVKGKNKKIKFIYEQIVVRVNRSVQQPLTV